MNTPENPTPEAGDTLTPGEQMPPQTLASASHGSAVTADVTGGPEGRVHLDRPAEEPRSQPTRAPAAVSENPFPSFMRRYIGERLRDGSTSAATDQPRPLPEVHVVPRILREAAPVTPPITPSRAPSTTTSVTPTVTAPAAGSICPTCQCRVPARLSAADRQRAYRERKRKQGEPIEPYLRHADRLYVECMRAERLD